MKLPILYSRASTGALRQWTIEVSDKATRTHSGVVGGKITISEWYEAVPTNEGRANARGLAEQALFEAKAAWKKKVESGYFEDESHVDNSVGYIEPMLAKKWEDLKDDISYPVYAQPKLDGMRCILSSSSATSRNGKPWATVGHIAEVLKPVFSKYPDLILDGELYNHAFKHDFNKITSLAKKTKPTKDDLIEAREKLQFWWYDIVDGTKRFSDRSSTIISIFKEFPALAKYIVLVPTSAASREDSLDELYGQYMEAGYEGQMVRTDGIYELGKRSKSLLKRKEFSDDEFKILDIVEGDGGREGMAGRFICELSDGSTFRSNPMGDRDLLVEYLKNKHKYIGKFATVKYFNLTPDGKPRFSNVVKIRSGKGID